MENQHRKISGYRELSADEIALMNEVKRMGANIESLLIKVQTHVDTQCEKAQNDEDEKLRLNLATPKDFIDEAKKDFQIALMLLTRAVAQPTTF